MWAVHCRDIADGLCNWDSCRGDVQRSRATATCQCGCVFGPLERILGDADHGDGFRKRLVQVCAQARIVEVVQPDVAIDDNARWLVRKLRQHRLNAWQFSAVDLTGLVSLDVGQMDDVLG